MSPLDIFLNERYLFSKMDAYNYDFACDDFHVILVLCLVESRMNSIFDQNNLKALASYNATKYSGTIIKYLQ